VCVCVCVCVCVNVLEPLFRGSSVGIAIMLLAELSGPRIPVGTTFFFSTLNRTDRP
jgi:hypothetical protein